MKRVKSFGFLLTGLFGLLIAVMLAHGTDVRADEGGGSQNPWIGQVRPGVMVGNSGNETDYFLDLLFPLWGDNKRLLFFNPHFRLGSRDSNEQNAGLGYRGLYFDDKVILGANLFVDTMNSQESNRYSQVGMGLELLTQWVDLRANYYYTFSRRSNVVSNSYSFSGTGLFQHEHVEEAPPGVDGEIGLLVPLISDYVETRVALGGYHYDSRVGDDINGTRARVEVRPIPILNLNAEFRDDDLGSATFIGGYLDIPFSVEALFSGKNPFAGIEKLTSFGKGARTLRERMTEKVVRDRHIRTFDHKTTEKVADIIFVNQDNPDFGNGTYENPYHNVMSAPEDPRYKEKAWVYVFSWDQNADTYSNVHLVLKDDMVLWGQGYHNPQYNLGGGPLPILDGGGGYPTAALPVLNGYSPGVVNLADNNEVMGLQIQNGGHGIYGSNISATYIHDNLILNNGAFGSGIHIDNAFNGADLTGLDLRYRISNNIIEDNSGSGIFLRTWVSGASSVTDTKIENLITDNVTLRNTDDGILIDTGVSAPDVRRVTITNRVDGNEAGENGFHGIHVDSFIGESPLPAAAAALSPDGVAVTIDSVAINDEISHNIASGNSDSGIFLTDIIGFSPLSDMAISGVNATIANAGIFNVLTGNIVGKNGGYGVDAFNAIGIGAFYPGASVSGMTALLSDSRVVNSLSGNSISNNASGGLFLENFVDIGADEPGSSVTGLTAAIQDVAITNDLQQNLIKGNGGAGVFLENNLSIAPYLNLAGIPGVNLDGPPVVSGSSAMITSAVINNTIRDNDLSGNSGDGLFLLNELFAVMGTEGSELKVSGSQVTNTLSGNLLNGNGGSGLSMFSILGSVGWQVSGAVMGAGDATLRVVVEDSGITNDLSGNHADNNGVNGAILANVLGTIGVAGAEPVEAVVARSSIDNVIRDNSFSNNGSPEGDTFLGGNGLIVINILGSAALSPAGATASVDSSSITNDVSGNTASGNGSNGVIMGNVLGAGLLDTDGLFFALGGVIPGLSRDSIPFLSALQTTVGAVKQINGATAGSVSASSIANTFSGNTVEGNGSNGVILGNVLGGIAVTGSGTATGDILSSSVTNTLQGNGISGNGSNGLILANLLGDLVVGGLAVDGGTSEVSGSVRDAMITNTVTGNAMNSNGSNGAIIGNALGVIAAAGTGPVTAEVAGSSIGSTVTDNSFSNNGGNGLILINVLDAAALSPATAGVDSSSISNDVSGNTFSGNGSNGVIMGNVLGAGLLDINVLFSVLGGGIPGLPLDGIPFPSGPQAYAPAVAQINGVGATAGSVSASSIANTFTNNAVEGNGSNGLILGNVLGVIAVAGSGPATGEVMSSSVTNTVQGNSISGNGSNGAIVVSALAAIAASERGTAEADVTGSSLDNAVKDNSISGNGGNGLILASVIGSGAAASAGPVDVKAAVAVASGAAAGVDSSTITNDVSGNTASDNGANGMLIGNALGAGLLDTNSPQIGAFFGGLGGVIPLDGVLLDFFSVPQPVSATTGPSAQQIGTGADFSGSVSASSIGNTITGNSVEGNGATGVLMGNALGVVAAVEAGTVAADVTSSSITNTARDNSVDSNGGNGLDVYNVLGAAISRSAFATSALAGSVSGSGITNDIASNRVNSNGGEWGLGVESSLGVSRGSSGSAADTKTVTGSGITDTIHGNQTMMNGGDGVNLFYDAPNSVAVTLLVKDTRVKDNAGDGLYLEYWGTNLNANLGDALTATQGYNSFAGNTGFDLNNQTGQVIKAENNWWGQSTGPAAGQISNPATVDYTPWLTSEP